jgi:pimeloyl-ACP methyl ester carboxylesterase
MAAVADRFHHGDLRDRLAKYHDDVDTVFGEWVRIWTHPAFADWDIRPTLASIDVPTLVVQGIDDEYATPGHVDLICEAVGRRAKPVLLPGCGHQPMFEATETMVATTERFCRSVLD